jgi:flagellar biosynthesis/type III secretory pathway protein FliH
MRHMGGYVTGNARTDVIETWEYPSLPPPDVPDWEVWGGGAPTDASSSVAASSSETSPPPLAKAEIEERIEDVARRSFEAGRIQGMEQGRAAEKASCGTASQRLSTQIERMLASFAVERDRYLQTAEREVVKLALAVAARILRREAQMDPLLLTGAVRVALGQLAASTSVRLRVPPAEAGLWAESIAHLPNLSVRPKVLPGDGMRLGDCVVETELGSVDLGVRAQLSEIERGFFDRTASASSVPDKVLAGAELQP